MANLETPESTSNEMDLGQISGTQATCPSPPTGSSLLPRRTEETDLASGLKPSQGK